MKARRRLQCLVAASMVCLLVGAAAAGETRARKFAISGQGELRLNVPASWTADTMPATAESPAGIQLGPRAGAPFEMLVSPMGYATRDAPAPGSAVLKKMVQDAADLLKPQAVERSIDIREIRGASAMGYYFSATDRAPKPGEFKIVTQGVLMIGNLLASFTVLTNDGQRDVVDGALDMIRTATYVAPSSSGLPRGQIRKEKGDYLITKGSDWRIRFPSSDFEMVRETHRPDGTQDYYMLSSDTRGLHVSFFVEPATKCATSAECRDLYWSNPGPLIRNPQRVRKYEANGFSIVEFFLPEVTLAEFKVSQMNISGHVVRGGYWLDMHISKVDFKDSDKPLFDDFVNAITLSSR